MSSWRLRRVWRAEGAVLQRAARNSDAWENRPLAPVPFTLANRELERLSRYEAGLQRSLERAYVLLERRQTQRAAEDRPPAAPQTNEPTTP